MLLISISSEDGVKGAGFILLSETTRGKKKKENLWDDMQYTVHQSTKENLWEKENKCSEPFNGPSLLPHQSL